MSNTEILQSKRDVITLLYNTFTTKLYKIIDVKKLFPEQIEITDLVFNLAFTFPMGCNIKNVVKDLIIIHNIEHTQEQFDEALEIIKNFLNKYNQV